MKRLRIKIDHTERSDVHDGKGGVYKHGDEGEFEDHTADVLIGLGIATLVGELTLSERKEVQKAAEEKLHQVRQDEIAARATSRSNIYDEMPPEWRKRVQEEGDGVIQEYLDQLNSVPLEKYTEADPFSATKKRKRG